MHGLSIKKIRNNGTNKTRFHVRYEDRHCYPVLLRSFRTEAKAKVFMVRIIFALQGENLQDMDAFGHSYMVRAIAKGLL